MTSYSLHKISSEQQFTFQAEEYSRFKFGDGEVASRFGSSLADGFIDDVLRHQQEIGQMVVVSSPYAFIPTATFAMKDAFVYQLNRWLAEHDHPVVEETKVHRTVTYKEDYGELSAEERLRLIGNDIFHIDRVFLSGKTVIFLDDIRITGSHERMIRKMIDDYQLLNPVYMAYFAELVNPAIPPNIENYLNYYAVKSIFDLRKIIYGPQFTFNTRLVKYLLNYESEAFRVFLETLDPKFIHRFYDQALGNSYHTIQAYQQNLTFTREYLNTTHKRIEYGD